MSDSRPLKLGAFLTINAAMVDPTAAAYRDLPHVSGDNIESGSGRLLPVRSAHDDGMTSGKYLFDAGTLLYSKIRPYLRKAVIAPFRGLCSADIYPVRVDPEQADRDYVHWLLLSPGFTRYAEECSRRARMPKLNREQLFAYPVQLPSPHEQKRLAAKLSAAMSEVAAARAAARERLNAANALPAAMQRDAFVDAVERPLGDLLLSIEAGKSPRCEERPARPGELGVLKVSAVSWGRLRPEENKVLPAGREPEPHHRVHAGDLLMSRSNTGELVGAVVYVRATPPNLLLSDKTLRLRPRTDLASPQFLELALRSPQARRFIQCEATGSSSSMRNMSQGKIGRIPVPWISMDDQQQLAIRLGTWENAALSLGHTLTEQSAAIDLLFSQLLREGFDSISGVATHTSQDRTSVSAE